MHLELPALWPCLPPAADDSPEQRLGMKLVGLGRLPCQVLPTMLEPGQQAFPL